jgi:hypothetical protein
MCRSIPASAWGARYWPVSDLILKCDIRHGANKPRGLSLSPWIVRGRPFLKQERDMKNETRELNMDELNGVSGGTPKTSTPPKKTAPPKPAAIEINDYSFGVLN